MNSSHRITTCSRLLFLDFDGVICDSIDECLVSSWIAWHGPPSEAEAPGSVTGPPTAVALTLRQRFSALRPYIRSGEDYLLIHELLESGATPRNQQEFDAAIQRHGPAHMRAYRRRFYQAREWLLRELPDYWYRLNHIYPHLHAALAGLHPDSPVYILSTKRPDFIQRILSSAQPPVRMNSHRILYGGAPGGRSKLQIISDMLDAGEGLTAVFVDDQPQHFLPCTDTRIERRLASWGYVAPQQLTETENARCYRLIDPEEMAILLREFSRIREGGAR